MTRRHNRHFYLDDDLTRCSGTTKYRDMQCSNWGKPGEHSLYWCHIHKGQEREAIYATLEQAKANGADLEAL